MWSLGKLFEESERNGHVGETFVILIEERRCTSWRYVSYEDKKGLSSADDFLRRRKLSKKISRKPVAHRSDLSSFSKKSSQETPQGPGQHIQAHGNSFCSNHTFIYCKRQCLVLSRYLHMK